MNETNDYRIIAYDDTGRVVVNTTLHAITEEELKDWRDKHEDDSWASVTVNKCSK